MNDCPNAEMRDQLPDLLHERLDLSARAAVLAHLDDCVDCRDELELLRDVRGLLVGQPRAVDVNYIVSALPKPPSQVVSLSSRRRPIWSDWRIAAAITLLVAGGGSYAVLRDSGGRSVSRADTPIVAVTETTVPSTPAVTAAVPAPTKEAPVPRSNAAVASTEDHAAADLGADNRLGDLSEEQLQTLLKDIGKLRAVPATEPDPVSLRIDAKLSSSEIL